MRDLPSLAITPCGYCVCVETAENKEALLFSSFQQAKGSGSLKSALPTKLLLSWEDIQAHHLDRTGMQS